MIAALAVRLGLADALKFERRLDEAEDVYRRIIELNSSLTDAWNNIGEVHKDRGELSQAIDCYRRAVELSPEMPTPLDNLIFAMHFQNPSDQAAIKTEHARWNTRFGHPPKSTPFHTNDRTPDRKLRIGFIGARDRRARRFARRPHVDCQRQRLIGRSRRLRAS